MGEVLYPVMLRLKGRTCVVIGGGEVAARKVEGLLTADACITVISPTFCAALKTQVAEGKISIVQKPYIHGILTDLRPMLVFAATDNAEVNRQVADEAHSIGAWVDVADAGSESDFMSLATVRRGAITIGISTGGASPALAAHLRERIEQMIGDEYTTLANWLESARSSIREIIPTQTQRATLWRTILDSSILADLRRGDEMSARALFDQLVNDAVEENQ